jgi:hypothetical protein
MLLLGCAMTSVARAQSVQPVLVLSVASQKQLWDVLNAVGKYTGDENFVKPFGDIMGQLLKMPGFSLGELPGVDSSRPWGIALVNDGGRLKRLGFLPITDEAMAMASLAPILGEPVDENGARKYTVGKDSLLGEQVWYLAAKDGYLFGAEDPAQLQNVPNPLTLTGALEQTYFFSLRIQPQNASEADRANLLSQLPVVGAMGEVSDGDAMAAFSGRIMASQSETLQTILTGAEQITLGWNLDPQGDKIKGDIQVIPTANSRLAAHLAKMAEPQPSRLAQLVTAGDVMNVHLNLSLEQDQIDRLKGEAVAYRDAVISLIDTAGDTSTDEERTVLRDLVNRVIDIATGTIDKGHLNVGVRLVGKRPPLSGVLAVGCDRSEDLIKLFDDIATFGKNDPGFEKVEVDVEKLEGGRIHAFTLAAAKGVKEIELLGKTFKTRRLVVGISGDRFCVGMGAQGVDLVKQALAPPSGQAAPVQVAMRGGAMAGLMGQMTSEQALQLLTTVLSMNLAMGPDGQSIDDQATLVVTPSAQDLRAQFEMGNGYLRAVGTVLPLISMALQGRGGGGGGLPQF